MLMIKQAWEPKALDRLSSQGPRIDRNMAPKAPFPGRWINSMRNKGCVLLADCESAAFSPSSLLSPRLQEETNWSSQALHLRCTGHELGTLACFPQATL